MCPCATSLDRRWHTSIRRSKQRSADRGLPLETARVGGRDDRFVINYRGTRLEESDGVDSVRSVCGLGD